MRSFPASGFRQAGKSAPPPRSGPAAGGPGVRQETPASPKLRFRALTPPGPPAVPGALVRLCRRRRGPRPWPPLPPAAGLLYPLATNRTAPAETGCHHRRQTTGPSAPLSGQ